jgi:hypothetical protein
MFHPIAIPRSARALSVNGKIAGYLSGFWRSPFHGRELANDISIAHLGLLISARQANRSHLRQLAFPGYFAFADSKCPRNDRPVALVAGISGDVKILGFHDEPFF